MGFIPAHGGHEKLASYQKTVIIYRATVRFCERFMDKKDRTVDQMIQAARSGKQNIVEASAISGFSKESEIKLLGFARASLEELLEDYNDRLLIYKAPLWEKDSREAKYARAMARRKDGAPATYANYEPFIETRGPAVIANLLICVIHQAHYLLDRQLARLEQDFLANGGIRERMTAARLKARAKN
jgi:four helix bundle suffix protein